MKRRLGWFCALPMLIVATVVAQNKPDFSGQWVLVSSVPPDPGAAQSLTVRQPIVRTNVFGDPIAPFFRELTVERHFVSGAHTETHLIGVEGGTVGGDGSQTRYSGRWEGDRLVLETATHAGPTLQTGPSTEHTEIWQLDPKGMLRLTITDRGSGIESTSTTLIYRKG